MANSMTNVAHNPEIKKRLQSNKQNSYGGLSYLIFSIQNCSYFTYIKPWPHIVSLLHASEHVEKKD